MLGNWCVIGRGVEKDYAEANAWLNIAAVQNPETAMIRDELETSLTPDVISAGRKRSKELRGTIEAKLKGVKSSVVHGQGAGPEWGILNQEATELLRTGKYDRAFVVAQKAL